MKEEKMSLTLILALKVSRNDFEMESVIMRKDYY